MSGTKSVKLSKNERVRNVKKIHFKLKIHNTYISFFDIQHSHKQL